MIAERALTRSRVTAVWVSVCMTIDVLRKTNCLSRVSGNAIERIYCDRTLIGSSHLYEKDFEKDGVCRDIHDLNWNESVFGENLELSDVVIFCLL